VLDAKRKKEMRKNLSSEMQGSHSISILASTYTGEYTCKKKKKESGRTKKVADEIGKKNIKNTFW